MPEGTPAPTPTPVPDRKVIDDLVRSGASIVDTSQRVIVGDRVFTGTQLAELVAASDKAQAKITELESKVAASTELQNDLKILWAKDADPKDKAQAAKRVEAQKRALKAVGWTDGDIAAAFAKPDSDDDADAVEDDDAVQDTSRPDQFRRDMVELWLDEAADSVLTHASIKPFIEGVERRDGKDTEESKAFAGGLRAEAHKLLVELLVKRREDEKTPFARKWIGEETPKVIASLEKKARLWVGDPKKLGVQSSAGGEASLFKDIVSKPPVSKPKFDPNKPRHDMTEDLRKFNLDRLSRVLAPAGQV